MNKDTSPATAPLLLSVKKAGEMLGCSPWAIRSWCYRGTINSHKIGTRLLVSRAEIDRILRESLQPRVENARQ